MGRELDVNFLFVPAAGSCSDNAVRSLKGEFSASPEQTNFRHLIFWRKTSEKVPRADVADPRSRKKRPSTSYAFHHNQDRDPTIGHNVVCELPSPDVRIRGLRHCMHLDKVAE